MTYQELDTLYNQLSDLIQDAEFIRHGIEKKLARMEQFDEHAKCQGGSKASQS